MKNILIYILILFIGCSKNQDIPEIETSAQDVIMPDTVNSFEIPTKIKYFENGCDHFKRIEVKETETSSLIVTLFNYKLTGQGNNVCPASIFTVEMDQVIKVSSKGDYTISFNKGKLIKKVKVL